VRVVVPRVVAFSHTRVFNRDDFDPNTAASPPSGIGADPSGALLSVPSGAAELSSSAGVAAEASEIRDADSLLVVDAEIVPTARASGSNKTLPSKVRAPPGPPALLADAPKDSCASCSACVVS
jgi:hypothetical protein